MATTSREVKRSATSQHERSRSLAKRLRANSLSIVLLAGFAVTIVAQSLTGHRHHNEEQLEHGQSAVSYSEYLRSGDFIEATMENWESEFLQMFAFVLLTAWLYQRGSAESKKLTESEPAERDPRKSRNTSHAPGPVRRGGFALRLYEHSLSITFFALFALSFAFHAIGGARAHSEEQILHGGEPVTALEYVATSRFWFESMQNWQSEFLALAAMVILSIYLRERGSAESKPVDAPHSQTGKE